MSERIYAELTEDFIRRMRNWVSARDLSLVQSSWPGAGVVYGRCDGSGYTEIPPGLLYGEAMDTQVAVRALPERYQYAVLQFWMYEGRSLRHHGRRRGIDYHTFEVWVIKGHELLKQELRRRTAYNQARAAIARAAGAGA